MDEDVMQLLKPLADGLQKVINQHEARSADKKTEPAPEKEAAPEAESKKERAEEKPAETDKATEEQQERDALRKKKERARLLQKLDLISL